MLPQLLKVYSVCIIVTQGKQKDDNLNMKPLKAVDFHVPASVVYICVQCNYFVSIYVRIGCRKCLTPNVYCLRCV